MIHELRRIDVFWGEGGGRLILDWRRLVGCGCGCGCAVLGWVGLG